MYVVIYYTAGTGAGALIVYGPFASQPAAQAFINGQPSTTNYTIAQVYPAPPYPAGVTPSMQNVMAGQFVVAVSGNNLTGGVNVYLYGPYITEAAANAYVAGRPYPGGAQVCAVQAAS